MMFLVMSLVMVVGAEREMTITKAMYDSMSQLVGEEEYPGGWWEERTQCLDLISPLLADRLELAWLGLVQYWQHGGAEGDVWQACDQVIRHQHHHHHHHHHHHRDHHHHHQCHHCHH